MKSTIKFKIALYYKQEHVGLEGLIVGWADPMGEPTNYFTKAKKFEGRDLPMVVNLLEKAYPDYNVVIEQTRS